MQELTHYIGGEHVKGTSGRFADVMNPATGEVQAKVPLASTVKSTVVSLFVSVFCCGADSRDRAVFAS